MTEKARHILNAMKRKDQQALKRWKLFNKPERRDRILEEFNRSTLDDVGPVVGEQGMKVLSEMNSLTDAHDLYLKGLMPAVNVL